MHPDEHDDDDGLAPAVGFAPVRLPNREHERLLPHPEIVPPAE